MQALPNSFGVYPKWMRGTVQQLKSSWPHRQRQRHFAEATAGCTFPRAASLPLTRCSLNWREILKGGATLQRLWRH